MKTINIQFLLFMGVFILDRVTKAWATLACKNPVTFFEGLSCHLVYNTGLSCGLLAPCGKSSMASIIMSLAILGVITWLGVYSYKRIQSGHSIWPEVIILAGAISNLADRFLYGAVTDFIIIGYKNWHFYAFNVADAAIVLGVFCIIIREWRNA